ncbi:MAG TPA: nuclease-related domain-containing protein [Candidatus Pacearchaeota archaeon]|nr:nuclease-related domain-containing protein [Candidatus Pacearchaeota archaeon]HPR79852.1 nuclease-related domain-containing protein [Candidatus Pacearchaeota archaeon]
MANNKDTFVYKTYKKKTYSLAIILLIISFSLIVLGFYLMFFKTKENAFFLSLLGVLGIAAIPSIEKDFDKKFNWLDRTWGKGAKAELAIMGDLEKMEECKVVNDFKMDRGNIDHICISPTGIFTLETKGSDGIVSYDNKKLKINGKELEKDFLHQARKECFFLDNLIKKELNKNYFIIPILVFANAKVDTKTISGPIENVWICQRGFECKVIRKNKDILTNEEMSNVYKFLLKTKEFENKKV